MALSAFIVVDVTRSNTGGTMTGPEHNTPQPVDAAESLVDVELVVEEVSIDGMCGVY